MIDQKSKCGKHGWSFAKDTADVLNPTRKDTKCTDPIPLQILRTLSDNVLIYRNLSPIKE